VSFYQQYLLRFEKGWFKKYVYAINQFGNYTGLVYASVLVLVIGLKALESRKDYPDLWADSIELGCGSNKKKGNNDDYCNLCLPARSNACHFIFQGNRA
jgi:hypothetical protein